MPSKEKTTPPSSVTSPTRLSELKELIEACRQGGVRCLEYGDVKLELMPQLTRAMVPSPPADEYTASRNGEYVPQSARDLEVAQMNREQEAWTRAQAPNVFSEGVDT